MIRLGWPTELPLFLVIHATYTVGPLAFIGDLADAREHARWIHEH